MWENLWPRGSVGMNKAYAERKTKTVYCSIAMMQRGDKFEYSVRRKQ